MERHFLQHLEKYIPIRSCHPFLQFLWWAAMGVIKITWIYVRTAVVIVVIVEVAEEEEWWGAICSVCVFLTALQTFHNIQVEEKYTHTALYYGLWMHTTYTLFCFIFVALAPLPCAEFGAEGFWEAISTTATLLRPAERWSAHFVLMATRESEG